MSTTLLPQHHAHEKEARALFGFWVYILSDCVIFATLFATYAVLHMNTAGGPVLASFVSLPFVLLQTLILLTSSFTYGLATLGVYQERAKMALGFLFVTFVLGGAFLVLEIREFMHLIEEGYGPGRSAALSAFFTLLGTHGFHVFVGLVWMMVVSLQIMTRGLTLVVYRKVLVLGLFWHFLDIVWIFIFTFVYLLGVLSL